jgi:hypothetical protein
MVALFLSLYILQAPTLAQGEVAASCNSAFATDTVSPPYTDLGERLRRAISKPTHFDFNSMELPTNSSRLSVLQWRMVIRESEELIKPLMDPRRELSSSEEEKLGGLEFQQMHNIASYVLAAGYRPIMALRSSYDFVVIDQDDRGYNIEDLVAIEEPSFLFVVVKNEVEDVDHYAKSGGWLLVLDPAAPPIRDVVLWDFRLRIVGLDRLYRILESPREWDVADLPYIEIPEPKKIGNGDGRERSKETRH